MSSHYRVLGVDPGAEEVVIRGAYLALIRRYHPDTGGPEADAERAQAITAAWEVLRDPARRAAYDEARRARFQPGIGGGVVVAGGPKVRGGAAGRNLFLLLAAATLGLGWWALQQPLGSNGNLPPRVAATKPAASVAAAEPEPRITPPEPRRDVAELPALPPPPVEPVADEVVLPPLPAVDRPRMPVKMADARTPDRRLAAPAPTRTPSPPPPASRKAAAPAAPTASARTASAAIDLAPLERHLQLLTDQSYQFADAGRRNRLFSTRETFLGRLKNCPDDACKRDAYLRRNQEVAEIMRK